MRKGVNYGGEERVSLNEYKVDKEERNRKEDAIISKTTNIERKHVC